LGNRFWQWHKKIGTDNKQKAAELLTVDGQQRLTTLFAVMKGVPVVREDHQSENIYIAFDRGFS